MFDSFSFLQTHFLPEEGGVAGGVGIQNKTGIPLKGVITAEAWRFLEKNELATIFRNVHSILIVSLKRINYVTNEALPKK